MVQLDPKRYTAEAADGARIRGFRLPNEPMGDGDWWIDGTLPENPTVSKALVDMSRKHAMVLWMMAGQSANEPYQQANWGLIGDKWNTRMSAYFGKALALQPAASGISGPRPVPNRSAYCGPRCCVWVWRLTSHTALSSGATTRREKLQCIASLLVLAL